MSEQVFLSTKDVSERYGYKRETPRPGEPRPPKKNFCQFCARLARRYSSFPKARIIGDRKFYPLAEIIEFERSLPVERASKKEAA